MSNAMPHIHRILEAALRRADPDYRSERYEFITQDGLYENYTALGHWVRYRMESINRVFISPTICTEGMALPSFKEVDAITSWFLNDVLPEVYPALPYGQPSDNPQYLHVRVNMEKYGSVQTTSAEPIIPVQQRPALRIMPTTKAFLSDFEIVMKEKPDKKPFVPPQEQKRQFNFED